MGRKAQTADERFIICAYKTAHALGDYSLPLNRYEVGKMVSIHPKGVDTICKLLIQANFIKKASEEEIFLTQNGEQLALRLIKDHDPQGK